MTYENLQSLADYQEIAIKSLRKEVERLTIENKLLVLKLVSGLPL